MKGNLEYISVLQVYKEEALSSIDQQNSVKMT